LIASDNFESYSSGSMAAGLNGGTGFNAAYTSDNSGATSIATQSLSYTNGSLTVSGGNQDLQVIPATTSNGFESNSGGNIDNSTLDRTFAAQSGTTVYFSFLLRASTGATSNNEFFQVGLSNSNTEPLLSVGASGTSASAFDFFVRDPGGSSSQATSSTVMSAATTYFIVGEASITGANGSNYNEIQLYVDPGSTQPATATVSKVANSGVSSLTSFNIRTARFATNDVFSVDDVSIGTTYADVAVSPEPGTLAMAGAALFGLVARRRRRV
jgi:MYXO-CTERM domain-containing protein